MVSESEVAMSLVSLSLTDGYMTISITCGDVDASDTSLFEIYIH